MFASQIVLLPSHSFVSFIYLGNIVLFLSSIFFDFLAFDFIKLLFDFHFNLRLYYYVIIIYISQNFDLFYLYFDFLICLIPHFKFKSYFYFISKTNSILIKY